MVATTKKMAPAASGTAIQYVQTCANSVDVAGPVLDGPGDPFAERLGHLVDAPVADHQPELGLEVERLQTGGAVVEVLLDVDAVRVGQLAVEVQVQLSEGLVAFGHGGLGGQRSDGTVGAGSDGRSASPWLTA